MTDEAPRAGLGETIAQAQTAGFFLWFHLAEVDEVDAIQANGREATGPVLHRFRPSGPRFHHLVELALGLDGDGQINAACLGIDRAFIAAARIRPFARDIAKSYLHWILPDDAAAALAPEIDIIGQFCDGESVVIVHSSAIRRSWLTWWGKRGGDMANVFMGKAARAERQFGRTRIVFENLIEPLPYGVSSTHPAARCAVPNEDEDAWLRMAVTATRR
jgi:hypothetical protein